MKIGSKVGDKEALNLLDQTQSDNAQRAEKKRKPGFIGKESGDDVLVDVALAQSIGTTLDPATMEAERRAKVEDLRRRIQNKTYTMPSSQELAEKLAEEINFEIADASRAGNGR